MQYFLAQAKTRENSIKVPLTGIQRGDLEKIENQWLTCQQNTEWQHHQWEAWKAQPWHQTYEWGQASHKGCSIPCQQFFGIPEGEKFNWY